jgi:hypothetical protein
MHTHTQNMELSVPGNKESNYKITKYGKKTNEYVTNLTLLFRLNDCVSVLVNMTGRLIDWLLSYVVCKTWHKSYFLLKTWSLCTIFSIKCDWTHDYVYIDVIFWGHNLHSFIGMWLLFDISYWRGKRCTVYTLLCLFLIKHQYQQVFILLVCLYNNGSMKWNKLMRRDLFSGME